MQLLRVNLYRISNQYGHQCSLFIGVFFNTIPAEKIVSNLIEFGAKLDVRDENGQTPLVHAIKYGNSIVISFISRLMQTHFKSVLFLFHLCCPHFSSGMENVVQALIEHGATVNVEDEHKMTPLHYAAKDGRSFAHVTVNSFTDIHFFIRASLNIVSGRDKIVRCLIKFGAKVDAKDKFKRTPLAVAIQKGKSFAHLHSMCSISIQIFLYENIVYDLVGHGAKDEPGRTSLHLAAILSKFSVNRHSMCFIFHWNFPQYLFRP